MPIKSKVRFDQYANKAVALVTMSAANTLTFEQIRFGVGTFQGVGLLIHRVEYVLSAASIRELVASTDSLAMAVTRSDDYTSLDAVDPGMIAVKFVTGLAANVETMINPLVTDYSELPGGGLIVPANPIYVGLTTAGAAAASAVRVIIYFTFLQLADKDYIELIQSMLPVNM